MVTDATRNGVWQEMLDAARLVRYYGRLADRYQRRHFCVRVALLTFGLVGASTVTDVLPEYRWLGEAQAAAGLVIAVLVAWDMLAGYATKGAVLDSIRRECTELETELRELWGEVQADELGDKEARSTASGPSAPNEPRDRSGWQYKRPHQQSIE